MLFLHNGHSVSLAEVPTGYHTKGVCHHCYNLLLQKKQGVVKTLSETDRHEAALRETADTLNGTIELVYLCRQHHTAYWNNRQTVLSPSEQSAAGYAG